MFFRDRIAAGRELASALEKFRGEDLLILGIPRGGVLTAAEIARILEAPLDVVMPRKIGAPGNPELAIGAVTGEGQVVLNSNLIASLNVSEQYIESQVKREVEEIKRRRRLYLGNDCLSDVGEKTVLIVDDGLATGYTALVAVKAIQALKPGYTVLAVPVAPAETVSRLAVEVDELICLSMPEPFFAVGQFYEEFHQVTDEEVMISLRQLRAAG